MSSRSVGEMKTANEDQKNLEELRIEMQTRLKTSGMDETIRNLVEEICSSKDDPLSTNAEEVLGAIYKRGLMDTVLKDVNLETVEFLPDSHKLKEDLLTHQIQKHFDEFTEKEQEDEEYADGEIRYYLKVEILGGKAFMDHLSHGDSTKTPSQQQCCKSQKLMLHVFYKSQRFRTQPVDCQCDPRFRDEFMIDIGNFPSGSEAQLLAEKEPLRIIIIREDLNLCTTWSASSSVAVVTSYTFHDWRSVLLTENGCESFSLELMGIGRENNVPVGLLSVRITVLPTPTFQVSENTFLKEIRSEKATLEESNRILISAGKQWIKEYLRIRNTHILRDVKLFAFDEKMVSRTLISFIQIINADRIFMTSTHAAWFVALIYCREKGKDNELELSNDEITKQDGKPFLQSLDTTISSRSGDLDDLAILLCSILLGFGLNAYVARGKEKSSSKTISWVTTFDERFIPTFWDVETGKYNSKITLDQESTSNKDPPEGEEVPIPKVKELELETQRFKFVSYLFNNQVLYSNIQDTDSVEILDWNLKNPARWKSFMPSKIASNLQSSIPPCLLSATINPNILSMNLEFEIQELVAQARMKEGLSTQWDAFTAKLMGQKLATYELEASTGGLNFRNFFEGAILQSIPVGFDFKGYHYHCSSSNARQLFHTCLKHQHFQEIVFCRGESVQLSLRVSVFPYAENVLSVRVMFGCKYMETSSTCA